MVRPDITHVPLKVIKEKMKTLEDEFSAYTGDEWGLDCFCLRPNVDRVSDYSTLYWTVYDLNLGCVFGKEEMEDNLRDLAREMPKLLRAAAKMQKKYDKWIVEEAKKTKYTIQRWAK